MEDVGSGSSEAVIETLKRRGWCFRELDQLKAIIMIHSALADDDSTSVVDSVESELANMDLKSIGGNSLPDPSVLRKSSHLLGPKVLQISSVRDVSRSSIEDFSSSGKKRLLRLNLTDGITEITAIEFSHLPSIPDDVVPGTKVRLENKVVIHSGIVCLNPKAITLVGGVVPSLYDEWQMNKKYSGFSRSALRISQESDGTGPPPFEKLQIGAKRSPLVQPDYTHSNTKNAGPAAVNGGPQVRPNRGKDIFHLKANDMDNKTKTASLGERAENKPSSSETRPKEVVECVPVQNQAAAQKLLQKMGNQNQNDRHFTGRNNKWKEKREETSQFTLDEWERRNAGANPPIGDAGHNMSQDEHLAWQLQNQFDLENSNVTRGPHNVEAEDIRMSMFNYNRNEDRMEFEGRSRGRGRGRGQGRGRGRGRRG